MSIAVIKTGGKQYLVKPGQTLKIEKIATTKDGATIQFETLLTADETGKEIQIGAPAVSKKATGTLIQSGKGKKILVVKYKSKVRYRRNIGHRQPFSEVTIKTI